MSQRNLIEPDTEFIKYIRENGGEDLKKCYQCATCSSVCQLSTEEYGFPRKQMLLAQWGLKDRLLADPGPWLCFYCGDCSKKCPRKGNPGETLMAVRRYLTSQYDWTGLSRLMYKSVFGEVGILVFMAALIVLLFTAFHNFGYGLLYSSGTAGFSNVRLDLFAPIGVVDWGDRILAVLLGLLLLSNAARMFYHLTRGEKIPLRLYITQLPYMILHGITQKQWGKCDGEGSVKNWLRHLMLVSGYAIMFTMVVVFLPWFQVKNSSLHWTSYLGYYATAVLIVSTVWIVIDRIRKGTEMHRFSHFSDWLFPIMLFLAAVTGILLNIFRVNNMPMPTYATYMIHMAVVVPMLMVEVPFGKWAHLLYRPLAIYIAAVKNKAHELQADEQVSADRLAASA